MVDKKQSSEPISEEMSEFRIQIQTQIQLFLMKLLQDTVKRANEINASLDDISNCLGSSVASMFYEVMREQEQTNGLTPEQEKSMTLFRNALVFGFDCKVQLLKDDSEGLLEKISIMNESKNIH